MRKVSTLFLASLVVSACGSLHQDLGSDESETSTNDGGVNPDTGSDGGNVDGGAGGDDGLIPQGGGKVAILDSRKFPAMATLGDSVILFGGQADGPQDDTWIRKGGVWHRASPAHRPGRRWGHAMTSVNGRVVMFGGFQDGSILADTWEWDGTDWAEKHPAHVPPARYHGALASLGGRAFMVGGVGIATGIGDATAWEWTGSDWLAHPGWLSEPATACMTSIGARLAALVTTYQNNQPWTRRTMTFDGASWSTIDSVPAGIRGGPCALASAGSRAVLYGGISDLSTPQVPVYASDTWEFDGNAWSKMNPGNRPLGTDGSAMAASGSSVVLYGGTGGGALNDTWEYDGTTWTRVASQAPPAFSTALAAEAGGKFVLYAGETPPLWSPSDTRTWEWNGSSWAAKATTKTPIADWNQSIGQAAMASRGARATLVHFPLSASNVAGPCETWEWDGTDWSRTTPSKCPPHRSGFSLAGMNDRVYLFGGNLTGEGTLANDTWEWDGTEWREMAVASRPPARRGAGFARRKDRLVLFGGSMLTDTWEWDGTGWLQKPVASHPASAFAQMATLGDRVLLFGSDGAWTWDGNVWSPTNRPGGPLGAFASYAGNAMQFGGTGGLFGPSRLSAHWVFVP